MRLLLSFLSVAALLAPAQHLGVGVKGGVPLSEVMGARRPYEPLMRPWTLGPVLEIDLPAGLGIELDLLWRRMGYEFEGNSTRATSFEFPLLAKYKFPGIMARPYVSAGLAFRRLGDLKHLGSPGVLLTQENVSRGVVLGAGLRVNALVAKLWPEIRYTRWNNEAVRIGTTQGTSLATKKSQIEVLVGITF